MKDAPSEKWLKGDPSAPFISTWVTLVATILSLFLLGPRSGWIILIVILVYASSFIFLTQVPEIVYKYFFVEKEIASQIISNILNEKGLQFQHKDNKFSLKGLDVAIELEERIIYRTGFKGTAIILGPTKPENMALIHSLREKIDMAFIPKGL